MVASGVPEGCKILREALSAVNSVGRALGAGQRRSPFGRQPFCEILASFPPDPSSQPGPSFGGHIIEVITSTELVRLSIESVIRYAI